MSELQEFVAIRETESNHTYPLRPSDIYIGPGCLLSTFGAAEIEQEAERLIQFFQERGCWAAFTLDELREFYKQRQLVSPDLLGGLYAPWLHVDTFNWYEPSAPYVVKHDDGLLSITDLFIKRCKVAADPAPYLAMLDHITDILKLSQQGRDTKPALH